MKNIFKGIIFTALALGLYFFQINKIPVWSMDEGRYAEIAREMSAMNDYALPHFNYLPYLEKPVLTPLLTAGAYRLLGETPLGARFLSIVAALAGLLLVSLAGRRFFSVQTGGWAALVLLTTLGFTLVGRFAVIDGFMTLLLSAAVFALMKAVFEQDRRFYFVACVCMGLGFLTKGLIGIVLPGLIWFVGILVLRRFGEFRRVPWVSGIFVVALVALPWMLWMWRRQPDFFQVFIVEHHLHRFLTKEFGRMKPFWFYAPILIGTCFPWSLFLPAALTDGMRRDHPDREKNIFLWIWVAVIFVFFSLPKSKLPYYILPVSVPLALILGEFMARWVSGKTSAWADKLIRGAWVLLVVAASAAFAGGSIFLLFFRGLVPAPQLGALRAVLLAGIGVLLAGSAAVFFILNREKKAAATLVLAGMIYTLLLLTFEGMRLISPFQSSAAEAQKILATLQPEDRVAVLAAPDDFSDLPFYLKRRILVAGPDRGTLKKASLQASRAEDSKEWFWSVETLIQEFNERTKTFYVLMTAERYREIASQLQSPVILMTRGEKILITN